MTTAFKHRLLGTTILILIGIIFLPDLLDGEKQIVKDDFKVIPSRPEFQGVQQQQAFDQQAFEQIKADANPLQDVTPVLDQEPATSEAQESRSSELPSQQYAQVTVTPEQTTVSNVREPALADIAWVIRVGSFSKAQNANALVTRLRGAGYTTFTRNITNTSGQQLTSVLVGPELRKEKLEQQLEKLQQLTGVEKLTVVRYQPVENN